MISYLLFDLDGTLTNSKEGITKCVQYALNDQGIMVDNLDLLEPFIGPPLYQSFQEFYHMDAAQAERAVEKYRERYTSTGWLENTPYPQIDTMLAALQAHGFHLAVASSKPKVFVQQILDYFELSQYFQIIEGSNLDGTRTDKKEVIAEVLRQWNHPAADRLLMIGDRKFDIIGAHEMGFDCVGVRFGFAAPGELEEHGAIYIADTVEALQQYLLQLKTK